MSSFQPSGFWGKTLQVYLLLLKSFWIKRPFSHPCRRPSDKGLESHVMHKAVGSGKGHPAEQLVEMHGSEGLRSPGWPPLPEFLHFTGLRWLLGFNPVGSAPGLFWLLHLCLPCWQPCCSLLQPKDLWQQYCNPTGKKKIFNVKAVYIMVFCFLLLFKLFASKSWFPEWFKWK